MSKYYFNYEFDFGEMYILEKDLQIIAVSSKCPVDAVLKETELIKKTYIQIKEYFSGKRKNFNIPISLNGTDFQKSVWKELVKIPYAKTNTYKEIAQKISKPQAYRAVGQACNKNPLLLLVPCHRVIGSNGKLTGFALGESLKERLLNLEEKNV